MSFCLVDGTCANCFLPMAYYNFKRTHLSLNKDAPVPRAVQAVGCIHVGFTISILGLDLR
jgi:hypothetical protein